MDRSMPNKVTPEQIDALMARVTYRTEQPQGTTTTFVHAFLDDRFYLASGHSACVDPGMFDAELGYRLAETNARNNAIKALWQFEGYMLYSLNVATDTVIKHFAQQEQ